MWATIRSVILGLATYIPGLHAVLKRGTGGSTCARYCYSVWLRHLVLAQQAGMARVPSRVAELGPGDSLGIGLAALLCGAETYTALDVVPHAHNARNLAVFDELVSLFRARAPIPGSDEFPATKPTPDHFAFPADMLTDRVMDAALAPARVDRLRQELTNLYNGGGAIRYIAPWAEADVVSSEQFDLIFSQAVLEHVDEIEDAYRAMALRLKPGGYMTHQIDFRSHGSSSIWNGHLGYSDFVWTLMRGRLPYLLNRTVYSDHVKLLQAAGLEIVSEQLVQQGEGLKRAGLARAFAGITDEDLQTSGAFIVSRMSADVKN